MRSRISLLLLVPLMSFVAARGLVDSLAAEAGAPAPCSPTKPNGSVPPGETAGRGSRFHGENGLWTGLWPEGTVLFRPGGPGFVGEDGSLTMKWWWWRAGGQLEIEGRRLDAPAPPLGAHVPGGYFGDFQATGLVFPTEGCWEVTGRVADRSLTFVVRVVKIDGAQKQR